MCTLLYGSETISHRVTGKHWPTKNQCLSLNYEHGHITIIVYKCPYLLFAKHQTILDPCLL